MRHWKVIVYSLFAASMLSGFSGAPAQVSVNIGVAPVCPYGYFDYAPYVCAPYGYYGPSWFVGGLFIGAGPWYHGYWGHGGYYGRGGYYGHPGYYGGAGYRGGVGYRGGGVCYARTGNSFARGGIG